jgi:hypothetical protein
MAFTQRFPAAHARITSAAQLLPPTPARRSDLGLDQHADRAECGRDVVIALGTVDGLKKQRQPRACTVRVDLHPPATTAPTPRR